MSTSGQIIVVTTTLVNEQKIIYFSIHIIFFWFSIAVIRCMDLLHAVLLPNGQARNREKKTWKFSIADSQESMILVAKSMDDLRHLQNQHQQKYNEFGLSRQPIVVVIGRVYYVAYESILYKFDRVLNAMSTAFKLHHVFNLKYQAQSILVWEFIQTYFFEINIDRMSSPKILALLSALE